MNKTNTVLISDCNDQIRLYINQELFIDQVMPFQHNRLTMNYNSNSVQDEITVTAGAHTQRFTVSPNQTVAVAFNK